MENQNQQDKQQGDPRTYAIIGAGMEVHRQLGCGFLEAVYQEAMELELTVRHVPFRHQVLLPVFYKGQQLQTYYRVDLFCYESIIVELKALTHLRGRLEIGLPGQSGRS